MASDRTDDLADRIADTESLFYETIVTKSLWLSGDNRVTAPVAADLLGIAEQTLANMRCQGKGPPSYCRAGGGSRVTYRLRDLAAWLEAGRME